jgi:hypothetical protein
MSEKSRTTSRGAPAGGNLEDYVDVAGHQENGEGGAVDYTFNNCAEFARIEQVGGIVGNRERPDEAASITPHSALRAVRGLGR